MSNVDVYILPIAQKPTTTMSLTYATGGAVAGLGVVGLCMLLSSPFKFTAT